MKIAQLQQQLDAQAKQLHTQGNQLEHARLKIRSLEGRLRLERIANYGKRSEKLSDLFASTRWLSCRLKTCREMLNRSTLQME